MDGGVHRVLRRAHAGDVIEVRVRQQDVPDVEVVIAHRGQQPIHLVTGIDDHALTRPLASDNEPVLVERRLRAHFEDHALRSYT